MVSSGNWCHFSLLQQFTVLHFFKIRPFTYLSPWMFSASCRSVSMRHLKSAGQDSQYVQSSQISTTPTSRIWKKILTSQFCQRSALNSFRLDRTPLSLFPKKSPFRKPKICNYFLGLKVVGQLTRLEVNPHKPIWKLSQNSSVWEGVVFSNVIILDVTNPPKQTFILLFLRNTKYPV